jgi:alpha-ketoglutarate-dependent 2,4-dichlorophenoxyacetate dioxygenase
MTLTIEPVKPDFVAVAAGVDLRQPLADTDVDAVHHAMDSYGVLIFPAQPVDNDQQLAFTKQLGRLQPAVGNNVTPQQERRLNADFSDVSNLNGSSRILDRYDRGRLFGFGNRLWHTDASFRTIPAKYSILTAHVLPAAGGNTEFADMRAAWDALDETTQQQLESLVAGHSQMYSRGLLGFSDFTEEERKTFAPVHHPMVRRLASSGRKSLYLGAHAGGIVDWPMPEARAFIFDLMEHATQPEFVYIHKWRLHDLVIWDNRQTMHRARPFPANEPRDMRRTTLRGEGPTAPQAA